MTVQTLLTPPTCKHVDKVTAISYYYRAPIMSHVIILMVGTEVQWLALLLHLLMPWFEPTSWPWPFCVKFACFFQIGDLIWVYTVSSPVATGSPHQLQNMSGTANRWMDINLI